MSSLRYPGGGIRCNIQCRLLKFFHQSLLVIAVSAAGSTVIFAADFQINNGDTFNLGAATLNIGCGNFVIQNSGTFTADSGGILLSGDWSNQGDFNSGSSSVVFNDDCGANSISTITGETEFHNLSAATTLAHELHFEVDQHQSVANSLVLTGAAGQLLKVRSTVPGSPAFLDLDEGGSQTIAYVDVQDNHASSQSQHLAPGTPSSFDSMDSGGNWRWFRSGIAVSVPTLAASGLALLVLLLALMATHLHPDGRLRL